jgi:hypothetical protein
MTEAEWFTPGDLRKHVALMWSRNRARKLRLFGVACCRPLEPWIYDPVMAKALLRAELFADGQLSASTLKKWCQEVNGAEWRRRHSLSKPRSNASIRHQYAHAAVYWACLETRHRRAADPWMVLVYHNQVFGAALVRSGPAFAHTALLEVFGDPFRKVKFNTKWRTDTAVLLARTMYESRDFSAMPILADALQDAGCDSDDVLNHCRDTNRAHVRGCWVVDLVLGKE